MTAAKGGKRPGAGRKPGAVTKKARTIANQAILSGEMTPLEFLLNAMRQEPTEGMTEGQRAALMDRRFEAAKAAAPYMHAKLANVTSNNTIQGQLTIVSEFPE